MNDPALWWAALPVVALVAAVYASVGHGGASGYLAVLALFGFAPAAMKPTALTLNLLVAGTAGTAYARAGHFSPAHFWPFALASIPASLVGAMLRVAPQVYGAVLAVSLMVAAVRLAWSPRGEAATRLPGWAVTLPVGAAVGLVAGMTGVGGGIYLSPLLLLLRWAPPKTTAAVSAAFIFVNSASGLAGHWLGGGGYPLPLLPLVVAAGAGGLLGARLGASRFSGLWLRRMLALVLLIAAVKLLLPAS